MINNNPGLNVYGPSETYTVKSKDRILFEKKTVYLHFKNRI